MKQIIAMHGWSGDSNSWHEWFKHFKKHGWDWKNGERGYGNIPPLHPRWQNKSGEKASGKRAVIGHSLGPHLLEADILAQATDVILLGSFSSFIPNDQTSRGLLQALKSMKKQLGTKEESTMLNAFLSKACQPDCTTSLFSGPIQNGLSLQGREKLKADLDLLIASQDLPKGFPTTARVLVVEGEKDSIVLPSARRQLVDDLTEHLQNPPSHWIIPGTGHALLIPPLIKKVCIWLEESP